MPVTIFCKGHPSWPKKVIMTVNEGWTIADALEHADITKKKYGIMAIANGKLCRLSTLVEPNDEITIYPRMGGG